MIIKRYRNRRLYDTEAKHFIVLADLERMVRQNRQFTVVDSDSGDDITLSVLTAVIGEQAGGWRNGAQSKAMLRAVIKLGGRKSMSILKNTVLAGIGFVSLTKKKAEALIDTLVKSGELSKSEKKEAVMELLAKAEKSAKDTGKKLSEEFDKGLETFNWARKSEFDKLAKKVDRLTRKINKLDKAAEENTDA